MEITIRQATEKKTLPTDAAGLGFGKIFTDHMFVMDYDEGQGWHDARVIPYAPIALDPAAAVFHYAQECFEGLKAYRTAGDQIQLFRPDCNARRLNNTHRRLCIPELPEEDFVGAVKALVQVERDWVPRATGASLYIRPFTIATTARLGVHAAQSYQFVIICSPSGAYYTAGLSPIKIYVEDHFVRACPGGTGFVKCGGNYAVSLLAAQRAEEKGYSQVLWLDSQEHRYVEEVGAMNIFFKMAGKIYTAAADEEDGTVLPGVTRRSIIELLRDWGYEVTEGKLAISDVMAAARDGQLEEVFGSGTAAVISPVKQLDYEGQSAYINHGSIGPLSQRLYDTLTGIQWGSIPDTKGWTVPVCQG